MYGGHNVVKAFNGEAASVEQFNEYNDNLYESAWKSQFFSGLIDVYKRQHWNSSYYL